MTGLGSIAAIAFLPTSALHRIYAAIPGAILLLVWMHWITIAIALVVFVAIFAIFVIIDSVKGHEAGEVRRGMCDRFPEFKKRAERDGEF